MNWLRPITRELRIKYYEWAVSEIDPRHPDAHKVARRLCELRRERATSTSPYTRLWRAL